MRDSLSFLAGESEKKWAEGKFLTLDPRADKSFPSTVLETGSTSFFWGKLKEEQTNKKTPQKTTKFL